jgi:hypothetical protein
MPQIEQKLPTIFCVKLAVFSVCLFIAPALAQTKRCTCDFAESKWEAYGTNAVCSTFMHKGRTSCEVDFGGYSADPNLLKKLGIDPTSYNQKRIIALARYFEDVAKTDRRDLIDPKFLQTILPIIMRGAYLRPMNDAPFEKIKDLDATIEAFFLDEKNVLAVSEAFSSKGSGFSKEFNGAKFDVGWGIIRVDHPVGRLMLIYFSPE